MGLFDNLFNKKNNRSAMIAKERLQIIVKKDKESNPIFNIIEDEIIEAIKKYIRIDPNKVSTNIEEEIDIMHVNAELEKKIVLEDSFLSKFFKKKNSASIAKERLQIIISRESGSPKFSKELEKDIKVIVMKYVKNNPSNIEISFDFDEEGSEFLELNISLPDSISKY